MGTSSTKKGYQKIKCNTLMTATMTPITAMNNTAMVMVSSLFTLETRGAQNRPFHFF
jgi:hypothetical protein